MTVPGTAAVVSSELVHGMNRVSKSAFTGAPLVLMPLTHKGYGAIIIPNCVGTWACSLESKSYTMSDWIDRP